MTVSSDSVGDASAWVAQAAVSGLIPSFTGMDPLCRSERLDDGYFMVDKPASITKFIEACRDLRYWARTRNVDQT